MDVARIGEQKFRIWIYHCRTKASGSDNFICLKIEFNSKLNEFSILLFFPWLRVPSQVSMCVCKWVWESEENWITSGCMETKWLEKNSSEL